MGFGEGFLFLAWGFSWVWLGLFVFGLGLFVGLVGVFLGFWRRGMRRDLGEKKNPKTTPNDLILDLVVFRPTLTHMRWVVFK